MELVERLAALTAMPPQQPRAKSFWTKMREALGA
jgi:hypothetical protein